MRSYDEILTNMKTRYTQLTGTDPDDASDIGIRLAVLAGEIFSAHAELNWLKTQMFPTTASGEYLDMHAAARGIQRKDGTKATGEVGFTVPYRTSNTVVVPEGTIVSTSGEKPVRFETTTAAVIDPGELIGYADVEALEDGAQGNVAPKAVCIMVTPVAGVIGVENEYRMTGGTDKESDELLRKRVLDSFVNIQNGTNKAYYLAQALSVDGVAAAGVVPRNNGGGTVDVFIADQDGDAPQALLEEVRRKLAQAREINVEVRVRALNIVPCDVYLTIEVKSGYSFAVVESNCRDAINDYFNALGGGQSVYLSEIGEAVAHVEGVANYSFSPMLSYDIDIDDDCAARCGTVYITERE